MSAPTTRNTLLKMSSFKDKFLDFYVFSIVVILIKVSLLKAETDFYTFSAVDIHGMPVSFEQFRGKPTLVVNVASACGYTNQHYSELQWIYEHDDFKNKLNILGFPCNQFGGQESGSPPQIEKVARQVYGTTFPLFMKTEVIGENANPIYKFLAEQTGKEPTWNFWKYLVDHNGKPVHAWGPKTTVLDIYPHLYKIVRKTPEVKVHPAKTEEILEEDEDDEGVDMYEHPEEITREEL